jgi:2-amino-4-hydroxy-6-hydroxymethyldihydropteridine diphosphokinase
MAKTSYALALGSNRPHGRFGAPASVVEAALKVLESEGLEVGPVSAIRATPALGPAGRGFANAAAIVATDMEPEALLALLKDVERAFGRRGGRRWGPRVLDLDILLWSEGPYEGGGLLIPHPEYRLRPFVLQPLAEIAPEWRDPLSGRTVRQLFARLERRRPVDRRPAGS